MQRAVRCKEELPSSWRITLKATWLNRELTTSQNLVFVHIFLFYLLTSNSIQIFPIQIQSTESLIWIRSVVFLCFNLSYVYIHIYKMTLSGGHFWQWRFSVNKVVSNGADMIQFISYMLWLQLFHVTK